VFGVQTVTPGLVTRTLRALADDVEIAAVRIGMLGSGEVAEAVAEFLDCYPLPHVVLDPVIRSSSGAALLDERGLSLLREMLPLCEVITPNIAEAATLVGSPDIADGQGWEEALPQIRRLASGLHEMKARAVIVTGGHLASANDYLSVKESPEPIVIAGAHIDSRSTHGTGCAYAMALACSLARGDDLPQAARAAKEYVRRTIEKAYPVGKGIGPVNHFG
jgi:hydroxymethylpyrimidine/phosphomethylpyrimidine kinase